MPCAYHINLEDGLITLTGGADVDATQLLNIGEQMLADPEFDPYLPQLIDFRNLTVEPDKEASARIRDFCLKTYLPRVYASIAVVINDSLSTRALSDMYHLTCAMDKAELFDHYDQALKWLMRREFVANGNA
jgi:hypothetical protein